MVRWFFRWLYYRRQRRRGKGRSLFDEGSGTFDVSRTEPVFSVYSIDYPAQHPHERRRRWRKYGLYGLLVVGLLFGVWLVAESVRALTIFQSVITW